MTLIEQFTHVVSSEQEDAIIPFLKLLNAKEKKALVPTIRQLNKYYSEYYSEPTTNRYRHRWSISQRTILNIASFVCLNLKDFDQSQSTGIINKESLDKLLPWYCPAWFNDYAANQVNNRFGVNSFNYRWYMELIEQGYLHEHDELTVIALIDLIFTRQSDWKSTYTPEALLEREITLKEHIWRLFKFESHIDHSDNYRQFAVDSVPGGWLDAFKLYTAQGKIDRQRLLKEAIIAANCNYNQGLSNWFMSLFAKQEPSKQELLQFADELLNTFNSENSKLLNTALNYFKELAAEPGFPAELFLEHVPLALTSPTKAAVASALMVLEKLAKAHPQLSEAICIAACQAFIHADEKIQVRAAKIIQKYGDAASPELVETIAVYHDALLLEAKAQLEAFKIASGNNTVTGKPDDIPAIPQALTEVPYPQTFDDFVFLASQAFDQNEPYHFDLLPAAILKFQGEITAANIIKLAPAFQRAYKIIIGDLSSTRGYLDNMLAKFFTDYGQLLVSFYPKEAGPLKEMRASFVKLEADRKTASPSYTPRISGIKPWSVFTRTVGYTPHKYVLLNALFMLERKISLPLLSTPTHEPFYVSSLVLVQRLIMYQDARVIPGDMDFQVAIARCIKMDIEETLHLADKNLKGENRQLVSFIFGGQYYPQQQHRSREAWLIAALVHNAADMNKSWLSYSKLNEEYLKADFSWSSGTEEYFYDKWDYQQRKNVRTKGRRSFIKIDFGEKEKQESAIKKVFNKLLTNKKKPELSIYDYTELKYQFLSAEHNDIRRLLSINPTKPGLLIAHIISKVFHEGDFSGENDKKLVIYTLETLLTFNTLHGSMAHVLIATCMISNDKTVRTYAAELWIKGVGLNIIDSSELGRIIGIHEQNELAPLKRFTDLILSGMYQVSAKHNHQLADLIAACISKMDDKPINNTKKLLDIYAEVLSVSGITTTNHRALAKLNLWQLTDSLEKSAQKIKKLVNAA